MLKDPDDPERELVRRVAALEGEEMVSSNDDDEGFKLEPGTCWVLCDNEGISPKVLVWKVNFCFLFVFILFYFIFLVGTLISQFDNF